MNKKEDPFLCVKEISQKLSISEITVYRLIASKKIPASKIGHQWRVDKKILDSYLKDTANFKKYY